MSDPVSMSISSGIANIRIDDGKNNVVSPTLLTSLNRALDQAEQAGAVVVLTGREGLFCAGFDLKVLKSGVFDAFTMLTGGFELARRLLAFPRPVVIACSGHAVAMGSFLLLSGDYRIGAAEDYRIVANEVEIGLTLPHAAIAICRQRLTPAALDRTALLSEVWTPDTAVAAGFLDAVVSADDLADAAADAARRFASLNPNAHRRSKLRMRRRLLQDLRSAIRKDRVDFVVQGLTRLVRR